MTGPLLLLAAAVLPPPELDADVVDAASLYTQCLSDGLIDRAPNGPPATRPAQTQLIADLRKRCAPARGQAARDAEAEAARDGSIPDPRQRALAVRLLLDQQDADFRADIMAGPDMSAPLEDE